MSESSKTKMLDFNIMAYQHVCWLKNQDATKQNILPMIVGQLILSVACKQLIFNYLISKSALNKLVSIPESTICKLTW